MATDGDRTQTLRKALTFTSHVSAPFISTFLLIHLSAPALANLGSSSLSTQTMLLGREYYQSSAEPLLVWAPLVIHTASSITKRILQPRKQRRSGKSILSISGYLTAFLLLPTHVMTHRFFPTDPRLPIDAVGPSQLDYEFVKVGLQKWPFTSWFLYAGIVGAVSLHMADGVGIIYNSIHWPIMSRKWRRGAAVCGVALPVILGLYFISREPVMAFSSLVASFEAVFKKSFVFRVSL